MSDRTFHVLDTIDAALDDFDVSDDAMRWAPEAEVAAEVEALLAWRWDEPITVEYSFTLSVDAMARWLRVVAGMRGKAFRRWMKSLHAIHRNQAKLTRIQGQIDRLPGSFMRAAHRAKTRRRRR